jgi:hypothetical protein
MIFSLFDTEDVLDTTSYCKVVTILVVQSKINGQIPAMRLKVFLC